MSNSRIDNTAQAILKELQQTHEHVVEELVKAVPQLEGDPTLITCQCGPKQVCKICPPDKKVKFLEHRDHINMQRTGRGPIRKFTPSEVNADSHISKKYMARRMEEMRLVAQKKLGRKLSRKEFKEITEQMARELYEKQVAEQNKPPEMQIIKEAGPDAK